MLPGARTCDTYWCKAVGHAAGTPVLSNLLMMMMLNLHLFQPHQADQMFDPSWVESHRDGTWA